MTGIWKNLLLGLIFAAAISFATFVYLINPYSAEELENNVSTVHKTPAYEDVPTPSRIELVEFFRSGDIATLNRILLEQQTAAEAGIVPEHLVDRSFRAFASTDPAIADKAAIWKQTFPDSFAPYLALARHHVHVAWLHRGTGTVRETHRERLTAMRTHLDLAVAELKSAITLRPKAMVAHSLLVWTLNANGYRDEAVSTFQKAVAIDPGSAAVREAWLRILSPAWGGSLRAQRAEIAQLREDYPDDPEMRSIEAWMHFDAAQMAVRNGDPERALDEFDKAIRLRASFLSFKADFEWRRDRRGDALLSYARLLDFDPYSVDALKGVAWLLSRTPAQDAQQRYVDRVLQLDPLDPRMLVNRAEFYLENGQRDLAVIDLDRALIYGSFDRSILMFVSQVLVREEGTRRRGKYALSRALELYPDDIPIMRRAVGMLTGLPDCASHDQIQQIISHYAAVCSVRGACSEDDKAFATNGEESRRYFRDQCVPAASVGATGGRS